MQVKESAKRDDDDGERVARKCATEEREREEEGVSESGEVNRGCFAKEGF